MVVVGEEQMPEKVPLVAVGRTCYIVVVIVIMGMGMTICIPMTLDPGLLAKATFNRVHNLHLSRLLLSYQVLP